MCIRDSQDPLCHSLRRGHPALASLCRDRAAKRHLRDQLCVCLLYTSDAADERSSVDLGGRRIIKKKKSIEDAEGLLRCENIQ